MKRLLTCIPLLLLIATAALAAPQTNSDPLPLVKMDDVKSAAMLLKTSQPGVFAEAPALKTDVRLHVRGIVLRGEVTQTFENTTPQCAEAVYVFPLPENAAVDTLRMTIGQRVIEGEIQEKKAAQQTYETAKFEGKHASLLTQERPNIFTVAIERREQREGGHRHRVPADGRLSRRRVLAPVSDDDRPALQPERPR
jgi:Ca-activated chloride channel family protein